MPYRASTIATVVNRLNVQYYLPAIQREFVWSPDQIVQLFDSLMRNYPISTFLLWDLKPENRDRWDIYRFIENFHASKTHNELASPAGIPQLTLVLDGQQRLTSLLVGLKGSYTLKKKYKRWDDPAAWVKHTLYLDLFKDPEQESEDGDLGMRYEFKFLPQVPQNDNGHRWFRVQNILNFDSEDRFERFKYDERDKLPDTATKGQQRVFEMNLSRLHQVVWKNESISYYTELDQQYDRVLDIFVRANEGGTKLSKSDLLLSMVTLKWEGINARDEIYGFVDRLNNGLARKNDFDKDFVMKTCLVLSDLAVQYKVDNFSNKNLALIQSNWEAIKSAIEGAVNLVNWFGIDRDTLTSANALIPLVYYLFRHPATRLRSSAAAADVRNTSAIRRWLTAALLNGVFGGQSDNVLRDTRKVLQDHATEPNFPIDALNAEIDKTGRKSSFDEGAVQNFLDITYGVRETFLALSLLYDDNSWGSTPFHQDHIFPRSHFTPKRLADSGLPADKQARYPELVNRIGNLELLLPHQNQEKSDQPFEKWLPTRDQDFRRRHLIPDDPELLRFDKFEEFVRAREDLIRERLRTILGFDPPVASSRNAPGTASKKAVEGEEREKPSGPLVDSTEANLGTTAAESAPLRATPRDPRGARTRDFVVFHNPEKMGGEYHHQPGERFGIVTGKKQVLGCVGDTVWLIQGAGKPRSYTLECRFTIEAVEEIPDAGFSYHAMGTEGITFDPPIVLSGLPWFQRFYDLQNHFSFGFNGIDPQTLRELETLAASSRT